MGMGWLPQIHQEVFEYTIFISPLWLTFSYSDSDEVYATLQST